MVSSSVSGYHIGRYALKSNAARRRCPAAPSDLPKSGGEAAPPPCCIPEIYELKIGH